jgi:uncharacterized protein RhaS with RHS repeats
MAAAESPEHIPQRVMTEWGYVWHDYVTNLVHKNGGTVLASFAYVRASGGEPTRITREDQTYVDLKYDAALRLTNEIYYSAAAASLSTNGYAYDAAGNRVLLNKGGTVLTNSVSAGYSITQVKDAANGNVVESYGYDNGGRVTSITRL